MPPAYTPAIASNLGESGLLIARRAGGGESGLADAGSSLTMPSGSDTWRRPRRGGRELDSREQGR